MLDKPDPRALLRLITERDQLKRELRAQKIKAGNLRFRLDQALRRTTDSQPKPDRQQSGSGC